MRAGAGSRARQVAVRRCACSSTPSWHTCVASAPTLRKPAVQSAALWAIGDLLSQRLEQRGGGPGDRGGGAGGGMDVRRTVINASYGGVFLVRPARSPVSRHPPPAPCSSAETRRIYRPVGPEEVAARGRRP